MPGWGENLAGMSLGMHLKGQLRGHRRRHFTLSSRGEDPSPCPLLFLPYKCHPCSDIQGSLSHFVWPPKQEAPQAEGTALQVSPSHRHSLLLRAMLPGIPHSEVHVRGAKMPACLLQLSYGRQLFLEGSQGSHSWSGWERSWVKFSPFESSCCCPSPGQQSVVGKRNCFGWRSLLSPCHTSEERTGSADSLSLHPLL